MRQRAFELEQREQPRPCGQIHQQVDVLSLSADEPTGSYSRAAPRIVPLVARVERLTAWCEIAAEDGPRLSFDVHETAELDDGRVLTLHQDRGFTTQVNAVGGPQPDNAWAYETEDSLRRGVLTTVLPDDDEPQDEHPWRWLVSLLADQGVSVTEDDLRAVPYTVEFGPLLRRRLAETAALREHE